MRWIQKMEARKAARREARYRQLRKETNEALKVLSTDLQISRGEGNFITPKEAAEIIGTNTNILQKMRAKGEGPVFQKVGVRVFYEKDKVEVWK